MIPCDARVYRVAKKNSGRESSVAIPELFERKDGTSDGGTRQRRDVRDLLGP